MKSTNTAEIDFDHLMEKYEELNKECDIILYKIHKDKILKELKEKNVNKSR